MTPDSPATDQTDRSSGNDPGLDSTDDTGGPEVVPASDSSSSLNDSSSNVNSETTPGAEDSRSGQSDPGWELLPETDTAYYNTKSDRTELDTATEVADQTTASAPEPAHSSDSSDGEDEPTPARPSSGQAVLTPEPVATEPALEAEDTKTELMDDNSSIQPELTPEPVD
ncbi:MAG: hypothetical protein OEY28_12350, partial [Nitrospira sp.]|nr:hypothetical protein [Nitrospira sp.]